MILRIVPACLIALFCAIGVHTASAADDLAVQSGRRVLAADASKKCLALLDANGKILWHYKIDGLHDMQILPGGNILMQDTWTHVLELTPGMDGAKDKIVWDYESARMNGNAGKKIEVHAFQRLRNGNTMIAESGVSRLIEVDHAGKLIHEIKLKVKQSITHRDTRQVNVLDNGNYLVSQEGEGAVREYDHDGKVVWEYDVPMFGKSPAPGHGPKAFGNCTFEALRLPNGNTLLSTGNGHSVLEVTPDKKIVWKLEQDDLPGMQLAWVTTLQLQPNGNIILGNCHATEANPQIIELTREKKVVWTFKDFKNFGDALSNSIVIDPK